MKERRARAEIAVDENKGWVLPTFGSKKPQFRYWAHVHFEKDLTWGKRIWTLLVDLDKSPDANADQVEATVYLMAPNAPQELLEEGAKFELLCGESHYTDGVIKRIVEVESQERSLRFRFWPFCRAGRNSVYPTVSSKFERISAILSFPSSKTV